jgi:hypothetical protein
VMKLLPMKDTMNTPMTICGSSRGEGEGGVKGSTGGWGRVGSGLRRGGQETYTHGLRLRP